MKRFIILLASLSCMTIGFSQDDSSLAATTFSDDTNYLKAPYALLTETVTPTKTAKKEVIKTHNVFTDYAFISFPGPATQVNISLSDVDSKVIYQNTEQTLMNQKSLKLNTHDLPNGVYTHVLIDEQNGKAFSETFSKN